MHGDTEMNDEITQAVHYPRAGIKARCKLFRLPTTFPVSARCGICAPCVTLQTRTLSFSLSPSRVSNSEHMGQKGRKVTEIKEEQRKIEREKKGRRRRRQRTRRVRVN